MKKKLAIMLLALASCLCLAIGFSACGNGGTSDSGTTDGGNSGTTDDGSSSGGGTTDDGGSSSGSTSHTMTYYAANEATCTEDGNSAYYYCSDCGKYFSDAEGTTEIALTDTVIPATGHSYTTEFTWTRTDDGYTATVTGTCSNCGDEQTVDATVTSETTPATCTENGSIVYTATAVFGDETITDTKSLSIRATGHTYSEEWSSDGSYHWHAAICEHTDEISDKAEHTFVSDGNGGYVCSVCSYENNNIISSTGSNSIAVGSNYVILASSDDSIDDLTFKATESGTYTISIPEDCQAVIRITDSYNTITRIGYSGYSDYTYSASFDLTAGESLSIDYITAGEGYTFDSEYVFCLTVEYEYKYIAPVGEEDNPYAFTNPDNYGGESTNATLAAGESYYFSVTSDSDTLSQITFSSDDSTAFELYVDGVKVDYGTYYFSSGTTTIIFQLKNVSSGELSNTIHCAAYSVSLSASEANTVTVTSAMLDSSNSITYGVDVPAATTYKITLGDGTDSNVAVYYTGYYGVSANELILGNGASAESYTLTNTRTDYPKTFYLTFVYTGDTIPANFTFIISIAEVQESEDEGDSSATYTAITLDEAFSMNFSSASTYYYSYTPTDSGNFTIVFTFTNTAFYNTLVSLITVTVNGTVISGSAESDGVYFVIAGGVSEYKIKITMTSATLTLTGTLKSGGEIIEITIPELAMGDNAVENSTLYSFTATTTGTYTFTVTNGGGYTVISSSESSTSSTVYFDEQESSESYFTLELTADETITLYISGGNDDGFTLTIS